MRKLTDAKNLVKVIVCLGIVSFAVSAKAEIKITGEVLTTLSYVDEEPDIGDIPNIYIDKSDFNLEEELTLKMNFKEDKVASYAQLSYRGDKARFIFDEVYINYSTRKIDVKIGKQRVPWGTGYAWNPIDTINPQDPQDLWGRLASNILKVDTYFTPITLTQIVILPAKSETLSDPKFKHSSYAIKVAGRYKGSDISISLHRDEINNNIIYGNETSGNILGLGVWTETAYIHSDNGNNYLQYLIGIDYTLKNGTYLLCEYHRDEKIMGKSADRFLAGVNLDITDVISFLGVGVFNINDGSFILEPELDIFLTNNLEMKFKARLFNGNEGEEFDTNLPGIDNKYYIQMKYSF